MGGLMNRLRAEASRLGNFIGRAVGRAAPAVDRRAAPPDRGRASNT